MKTIDDLLNHWRYAPLEPEIQPDINGEPFEVVLDKTDSGLEIDAGGMTAASLYSYLKTEWQSIESMIEKNENPSNGI